MILLLLEYCLVWPHLIEEQCTQECQRSLQRALRRRFNLLYGTAYGAHEKKPAWHFPEKVYENEETLRLCAESALKSVLGGLLHTYFVGNAPFAYMTIVPTEDSPDKSCFKDNVRTDTYRAAIMRHQNSISGKVVMDVGCGTGILSIFCALAGARRVYAVEASDIAVQANEVVIANNLSDKVIVLHARVEDVNIDEKVDIIISEWMGYILLYESMLASVIFARDKWLRPGGLILPSHATLYMAPITHADRYSESIDFWRNVYGIDMSAMLPLAKQCAFEEPSVETITGENVLTWPHVVKYVDCYTVVAQELESVTTKYRFESMMRAPLHGFAFWFDVEFNGPALSPSNNLYQFSAGSPNQHETKKRTKPDEALVLSTAPEDAPTHWQQTVLYFYEPIEVQQDQVIEGSVTLSQSQENPRFMNIHLECSSGGRTFVKESVMR